VPAAGGIPEAGGHPEVVLGQSDGTSREESGGEPVAARFEVRGVVQGVGFRPFVHRLAVSLGLTGRVGNTVAGVIIETRGPSPAVDELAHRLVSDAPPLARVDEVVRRPATAEVDDRAFAIVASVEGSPAAPTLVPPDSAVCDDCLAELFDPADRRYLHPFITCTNCGPRFTIITGLPYDRPATTMSGFELCPACASEYHDPGDRRFHAQPLSCPRCGPTLRFGAPDGAPIGDGGDPIGAAVAALEAGRVVAIKGLGGYHLACDATDDGAVGRLRAAKHRPDKPLAVMVAGLDQARELAEISGAEADQLTSPARPIVLLRARSGGAPPASLSPLVAPNNPLIGLFLPYTPIHHLLLRRLGVPLVLTSGNQAGEPICHRDDQVAERLGPLCDAVLTHDRPIAAPCDDSVVRLVGDVLLPIRRARGYAPVPVDLDPAGREQVDRPPVVLAVGGELKNTFALASGGRVWVSQHLGDLGDLDTLEALEAEVARFCRLYRVDPEVVAADAHPGYLSSSWARRRSRRHGHRLIEVQHHHAHVASVVAEHGWAPDEPVLGFAFDGTGYGHDGGIWGGELLVADATTAHRVAHLAPVALPGGDAAVRHPCRTALAHLWAAGLDWAPELAPVGQLSPTELALLRRQLERGVACTPTTSMGRLFDAVASLIGLRHQISFEAQAAIDLETVADDASLAGRARPGGPYRFELDRRPGAGGEAVTVADPGPVLASITADLVAGLEAGAIALAFHHAVADLVADLAVRYGEATGITTVALSGGVFQNALLTLACRRRLEAAGRTVLTHRLVPANDGGLALGQAYLAAFGRRSSAEPVVTRPSAQPRDRRPRQER
jgi:hydrogenase maturation protein HypF